MIGLVINLLSAGWFSDSVFATYPTQWHKLILLSFKSTPRVAATLMGRCENIYQNYIKCSIVPSWINEYTSGCSSFTSLRTFTFSYHPDVPIYPDGYLPIYCTIRKNNIAYHNDLWKEKQVCGTNWCTETKHDPSSALQPLCTSSGSETSRQQVTLWYVFCTSLSSCPILIDYITIRTLIIDILRHNQ